MSPITYADSYIKLQKRLSGIFAGCLAAGIALYFFPSLKLSLGIVYPVFVMVLALAGLTSLVISFSYFSSSLFKRVTKIKYGNLEIELKKDDENIDINNGE